MIIIIIIIIIIITITTTIIIIIVTIGKSTHLRLTLCFLHTGLLSLRFSFHIG